MVIPCGQHIREGRSVLLERRGIWRRFGYWQGAEIGCAPAFSPDGAYVLASGIGEASEATATQRFGLWRIGGVITADGAFIGWGRANQALILTNSGTPTPSAFDLSSHAVSPLESNSRS